MNRITFTLALAVFLSFFPAMVCAQPSAFEAYREQQKAKFNASRDKKTADFKAYRDSKNAEMAEFIRKSWVLVKGEVPAPRPKPQEPELPPVVMPEDEPVTEPENKQIPVEVIPEPEPEPAPKPYAVPKPQEPIPDTPRPKPVPDSPQPKPVPQTQPVVEFTLYGTSCRVRFDAKKKPVLSDTSEQSVAQMWDALCSESCLPLLEDCLRLREELSLCDWAYYQLCGTLARTLYGADNHREAVVFQTAILLQSGFDVMMGRDAAGKLYLLTASNEQVFNCVGFMFSSQSPTRYYLLDGSNPKELYMMSGNLPELGKLRLRITQENRFAPKLSPSRPLHSQCDPSVAAAVRINENLTSFYAHYPQAAINNAPLTRWQFFAQVPASREMVKTLYPSMKQAISGKGEREAVEILLHFVQTAFKYKLDEEVWGCDRPFFADETLYYPYCDCEDRSILFSRMVRDLLGLDVVLVYYPGHLATAVSFNEEVKGDYLLVKGRKFVICDPTYIPAPVGKTMPGMNNKVAKSILL